ncbi:MAG: hypothetical protein U5J83_19125 [Bryobacterales bacterium]|nr:hypothetical protein [Bryobacterales bacterium]
MTRFDPSCVVHRAVTHGSVPAAVSRYASFVDANLIVLSRQPPSLWQRLRRRRSMIEQIVEAATKPVLVGNLAKGASPLFSVCPRILCMVPLTDDRRGFLTYAQSLAQQTGGELLLLAATPQVNEGLLLEMIAGEPHPLSPELALEQLQSLGASLAVPNRSIVVSGSPSGDFKVIQKHRIDRFPPLQGRAASTNG